MPSSPRHFAASLSDCRPRSTFEVLVPLAAILILGACARSGVTEEMGEAGDVSPPSELAPEMDPPSPETPPLDEPDAGPDEPVPPDPPDPEPPPTPSCGAAPACSLDTNLGEIQLYGDSGTQLTTSGQGHAWVTLEAQDEHDALNFGSFASYVSVEATLDAASAPDYEVFVYAHTAPGTEKNDQDPRDLDACLTANDETLAALASSCARWSGDGPVVDNLRSVVIEVRPLGDGCTDWELTVIGYNDDDRECAGLNENNGM